MVNHYSYRVSWSEEDQEFVGTCAEFPSLSHLDEDQVAALHGIVALVADVVRDMQECGEAVPAPIASRAYSGQFVTRVPADLHRRLALEAAEAQVSLNRLVSYKLAAPVVTARVIQSAQSVRRVRHREPA